MYLSLYCKGLKRVTQGLRVRGSWRPNITATFWPLILWPSALCLSCSPDAQPEAQLSAGWWLSLLHLISIFSGPQLIRAPSPFGLVWLSLPQLVYNSVSNCNWNSVLTDLYNSPTPTRSLEWHDWSSSSGNNCHAVHRSLSSGASVYECIMGFTLSHFISQIHPRDLFRLLAIGMCHFLPVHHFVMACLLGPKVKIQQSSVNYFSKFHMWNFLTFVPITLTQNNLQGQ